MHLDVRACTKLSSGTLYIAALLDSQISLATQILSTVCSTSLKAITLRLDISQSDGEVVHSTKWSLLDETLDAPQFTTLKKVTIYSTLSTDAGPGLLDHLQSWLPKLAKRGILSATY